MRVEQQGIHRGAGLALVAALSLLLSACASLRDTPAPAAPVSTPVTAAAAETVTVPESAAETIASGVIDGINREGRVLQFGRFAETPPPVTPADNDVVELNYEQEELRIVFEQLGDVLGLNLVIDPTIDARVSVRTSANNPLRHADIWPLMRLLARNAGVTIEQAGNVYEFKRNASNVPVAILGPDDLDTATASQVLQVTPLTYISAEAAETALTPLLQPEGSIVRMGASNLLGINGTPQQLLRINALLAVLDDDPFQNRGIRLYELRNSSAENVAEELADVLTLIEGELSSYQVLGLERINAVLVVAPAGRGFDEVDRWLRVLDAASQEQVEQLFVYRVKNLEAPALATTLSAVFGSPDGQAARNTPAEEARVRPNQPRPAVPDALPQGLQFAPLTVAANGQAIGAEGAGVVDSATSNATAIVSANLTLTIVADEDTNSLLVRATPREYRQLLTTISALDTAPAQVLINAVIGQVTLTDNTEFGIDWTRVSSNAASGPARLSTNFLPNLFDTNTGEVLPGAGLVLTRTFMDGSAVIDATLYAIAEDNDVDLLARPTILATNNQEGEIKVGQNVPVNNGVTIGIGGQQTENIAYRDVGIVLTITPRINADGLVNLEIFQSLSSVGTASGVANNPIFTNQEITTTVVVSDQSTIALGGLIQDDNSNLNTGVPYLQRVPLLGSLFSYQQQRSERRELFIILRPQIIRGDGSGVPYLQQLRSSFTHVSDLMREAGL